MKTDRPTLQCNTSTRVAQHIHRYIHFLKQFSCKTDTPLPISPTISLRRQILAEVLYFLLPIELLSSECSRLFPVSDVRFIGGGLP